jgi:hypothetical protein
MNVNGEVDNMSKYRSCVSVIIAMAITAYARILIPGRKLAYTDHYPHRFLSDKRGGMKFEHTFFLWLLIRKNSNPML